MKRILDIKIQPQQYQSIVMERFEKVQWIEKRLRLIDEAF